MVYTYNLRILHQVINLGHQPPHQRMCISHFILHSLFEMGGRVKSGKLDAVEHHGLIKLIIFQKLQECNPFVSWEKFIYSSLYIGESFE